VLYFDVGCERADLLNITQAGLRPSAAGPHLHTVICQHYRPSSSGKQSSTLQTEVTPAARNRLSAPGAPRPDFFSSFSLCACHISDLNRALRWTRRTEPLPLGVVTIAWQAQSLVLSYFAAGVFPIFRNSPAGCRR
jgi:hypothetical protein